MMSDESCTSACEDNKQLLYMNVTPSGPKYKQHFFYTQNLPGQISKLGKTTQALSVYRKGTFCIYIKCLIVIFWKVTIERRFKKGSYFGVPV